ncbi:hypothetical protein CBM2592_A170124 [Cupriavidus taiwanensis]|nr:hypothetical protein CBM2592_A170124 [Cupriavidus taiwanensis]SOY47193.1 hypothetical protein CBM2588_A130128 [Cupriavidus taiwanensis]SOY82665.1 hypothetical protein CBM2591_A210009 [Cupriavidus taiwanensis]SOZ55201.1 hypothetical protein CBM2617_A190010 [Cupriavidus taiwanensis]SOZ78472.1 hypothetical protein CBM2618_A170125 [Cupriavidus taiwanensis]
MRHRRCRGRIFAVVRRFWHPDGLCAALSAPVPGPPPRLSVTMPAAGAPAMASKVISLCVSSASASISSSHCSLPCTRCARTRTCTGC